MKQIEVYDAEAPIEEADFDALEKRLGVRFPRQYRNWLLKHNGGQPVPGGFRFKHETGPYTDSVVAWFFALYEGDYENLELEFSSRSLAIPAAIRSASPSQGRTWARCTSGITKKSRRPPTTATAT
jgi:hypothetical protein